uniref:Nif11-like leader peptide family natural product n=1 Tax=Oscillatoriales cyanobacterium SpSt-402 TaxID=2282168 RepID=A0A832H2P2_9CYAN
MATATVLKFMQKTAEDDALRQQLEKLLGVGDGNISSEADLDPAESEALKGERAPVVAEFAAMNGYDFSVDELVTVVDAFQKHQAGELTDDAFAALLGIPATVGGGGQDVAGVKKLKNWFLKTYLGVH